MDFLGNDFVNCVNVLTGEWKMTESQLLSKLYFFFLKSRVLQNHMELIFIFLLGQISHLFILNTYHQLFFLVSREH